MDAESFDTVTRALSSLITRRRALETLLAGSGLGGFLARDSPSTDAKKRKGKKGKKGKKKDQGNGQPPPPPPPPPGACVGDCSGKSCGDDGCGGSCGTCAGGKSCEGFTCVCPPGQADSGGVCATPPTCQGSDPITLNCDANDQCCSGFCVAFDFCGSSSVGQPCHVSGDCQKQKQKPLKCVGFVCTE
jgi:hypothetical protein